MDQLNICVVGCGDIFEKSHIEHWENNPNSRIYSVVDIDPDVAKAAAERVNAEVWHTDYREAFADPKIDAVDIALQHQLHLDAVEAACHIPRPILCEKPMAMRVADAEEMNRLAASANVPLSIRHTLRYHPTYQEMRKRIQAGDIGEPIFGAVQCGGLISCERLASLPYWHWFKQRGEGGGAIAGVGVHGVDVLLWMVDGKVKSAWAAGGQKMLANGFEEKLDVEDTAAIAVSLEGGAVLQVTATWALRGSRPPAEVQGTEGALIVEADRIVHIAADGTQKRLEIPPIERTITDDFVDAVLHGAPLPAPGTEVIESVKVLEACYAAMDPLEYRGMIR